MGEKWTLETAATERPPGLHPFAGARLRVFLRHALLTPGLDPRTRRQRVIAWIAQLVRLPFTWIEKAGYEGAIHRQTLKNPPVFVIGHWRSGTTHLHNLMCRDPQFGYLQFAETAMPQNMAGPIKFARNRIKKALPKNRGMDNVKLSLEEPQEEEMALGNLNPVGYYSIYYFPEKMAEHRDRALFFDGLTESEISRFQRQYEYLIRKVSLVKEGRQLLFKNPPSTTRMEMILKMHPDARFIHIVRNPWEVYCSTRSHFPRIFNAFAWQSFQNVDISGYTIETYEKLMRRYLDDRDRLTLPSHQLVETSYEKISGEPLEEIGRIYDALGLESKAIGLVHIKDYLEGLKDYQRNTHQVTEMEADQIQKRWGFAFDAWGYDSSPPASIEIV